MKYVCNVIGNLVISDLNLNLTHMEIIDLFPDDFKSSPKLRDALRLKQIVPYALNKYPRAKRLKQREPINQTLKKQDTSDLKEIYKVINAAADRIEQLFKKSQETEKVTEAHNASDNDNKLNELLRKIDNLSLSQKEVKIIKESQYNKENASDEEVPVFVPSLETEIEDKKIQLKEAESEGTSDILEKLKKLKGN